MLGSLGRWGTFTWKAAVLLLGGPGYPLVLLGIDPTGEVSMGTIINERYLLGTEATALL